MEMKTNQNTLLEYFKNIGVVFSCVFDHEEFYDNNQVETYYSASLNRETKAPLRLGSFLLPYSCIGSDEKIANHVLAEFMKIQLSEESNFFTFCKEFNLSKDSIAAFQSYLFWLESLQALKLVFTAKELENIRKILQNNY